LSAPSAGSLSHFLPTVPLSQSAASAPLTPYGGLLKGPQFAIKSKLIGFRFVRLLFVFVSSTLFIGLFSLYSFQSM
jgi:hypothetical protein